MTLGANALLGGGEQVAIERIAHDADWSEIDPGDVATAATFGMLGGAMQKAVPSELPASYVERGWGVLRQTELADLGMATGKEAAAFGGDGFARQAMQRLRIFQLASVASTQSVIGAGVGNAATGVCDNLWQCMTSFFRGKPSGSSNGIMITP